MLLSRIGLAAACLGEQGQVLSANAAARAVLRQLGPEVRMRLARADQPMALDRVQTGLPMLSCDRPMGRSVAVGLVAAGKSQHFVRNGAFGTVPAGPDDGHIVKGARMAQVPGHLVANIAPKAPGRIVEQQ